MSDLVQKIADDAALVILGCKTGGVVREQLLEAIRKAIEAARQSSGQERGEEVAWQFYQDGKWWNGFDTNNHRANTEAAGIPTRALYAAPTDAQSRIAELEAQLDAMRAVHDLTCDAVIDLEGQLTESREQIACRDNELVMRDKALDESREREGRMRAEASQACDALEQQIERTISVQKFTDMETQEAQVILSQIRAALAAEKEQK